MHVHIFGVNSLGCVRSQGEGGGSWESSTGKRSSWKSSTVLGNQVVHGNQVPGRESREGIMAANHGV